MGSATRAGQRTDDPVVGRIRDRVRDLVEPVTTLHTQWVRSADGVRLEPHPHTVEHPSLVAQLHVAVGRSTAGASGAGYESRPPANLEAVNALGVLRVETRTWVRHAYRSRPAGITDNLHTIASRAHELDHDRARTLDGDVLRWWAMARVVTTWDTPALRPFVPCMACDARGKIRVRLDPTTAVCLACGAAWDSATIGILGEHIRIALDPAGRGVDAP